jgi:hypothetical protein
MEGEIKMKDLITGNTHIEKVPVPFDMRLRN